MKRLLLAAGLFAGAAVMSQSASAQSFRSTCPSVSQRGPIVQAMCLNIYGQLVPTSIDTRYCGWGDIANSNGQLTCRRPRRGWDGGGYGGGYGGGQWGGGGGWGYQERRHGPNWGY